MAGAGGIKAPTLTVYGTTDACCTPENAQAILRRALDPEGHIELYDDENRVNQAVAFANEWLGDQP
jgi:dienelactone hydrolase